MTKQQPARRGRGTVGEKIVISVFGGPLHGVREYQSGEYANRRTAARRIDSALRRAVKAASNGKVPFGLGALIEANRKAPCA